LGTWANDNKSLAADWVKDGDNKDGVTAWLKEHREVLSAWKKDHPDDPEVDLDKPDSIPWDDLGKLVLARFAELHPKSWPQAKKEGDKSSLQAIPVGSEDIADLQSTLFDAWLQDHPQADLVKVPADRVLSSGSGLDPHITLRNAQGQLEEHVADAWVKEKGLERKVVVEKITGILEKHSFRPLSGLVGEPLVNVLEVNRAVREEFR
jgi:K+-transporting ATPase ATPase C chain